MKKDILPFAPSLIRRGLYYQQFQKFFELFAFENILILGFREFIDNPKESINKLCKFLKVPIFRNNRLKYKPINKKKYLKVMLKKDRLLLEKFYEQPNEKLFELIGDIDW